MEDGDRSHPPMEAGFIHLYQRMGEDYIWFNTRVVGGGGGGGKEKKKPYFVF